MKRNKYCLIFVLALVLLSFMATSTSAQLSRGPITIKPIIADSDKDGIRDTIDNCLTTYNPDQADKDGDGIGSACDNCPDKYNSNQTDSDSDGIGDICELARIPLTTTPVLDSDRDGVRDTVDNCPLAYNSNQSDSDGDGTGDACERIIAAVPPKALVSIADADGDKISDRIDNCPKTHNPDQADKNADGVGDACQYVQPAKENDTRQIPQLSSQVSHVPGVGGIPSPEETRAGVEDEETQTGTGREIPPRLENISKVTEVRQSQIPRIAIFPPSESQDSPQIGWPDTSKIPDSEQDLENQIYAVVASDENIERVSVTNENVTMDYRRQTKLFGLININYTLSTKVTLSSGKVEAKKPWWTLFTIGDVDTDVYEKDLESKLVAQDGLMKQSQITQTLSSISRMMHDVSKTAINNTRA